MTRIRKILSENYVRPDESEKIKSHIRELGQYTVIDKVSARLDEYRDLYVAQFTNLSIEPFVMPDEYVRQHTKILTGGIWCIMRIQYLRPEDIAEDPLTDIFDDDPAEQRGRLGKGRTSGKGKRGPETPLQDREPHPHTDAQPRPVRVREPSRGLHDRRVDRHCCCGSAGYEPSALDAARAPALPHAHGAARWSSTTTCASSDLAAQASPTSTPRSRPTPICYRAGRHHHSQALRQQRGARRGSASGWWGTGTASRFDEVAGMNFTRPRTPSRS